MEMEMEITSQDIVIVGAGISGLTTALALHRLGIGSLVLESSERLRITGFALTMWTNAWRALDTLGVGDLIRKNSQQMQGFVDVSDHNQLGTEKSESQSNSNNKEIAKFNFESRCVKRKDLMEILDSELPRGTIRYSSKVVSIDKSGKFKFVTLSDGSVVKAKVLIGCDGVNSLVAKWLGLRNPDDSGRSVIRGFVDYPDGHGFQPKFHASFGGGVRIGFIPCDRNSIYWFCTFRPTNFKYDVNKQNPLKMKQFVLHNIQNVSKQATQVVEKTELQYIFSSPLKLRFPCHLLTGQFTMDNVCVVGDAFHPMTPDIGQGGCSALEDSIVLARCIKEAITSSNAKEDQDEYGRMKNGLERYVKKRRWRSFSLISAAYMVGLIQESDGKLMSFLRDKFLGQCTIKVMVRLADFDCGR